MKQKNWIRRIAAVLFCMCMFAVTAFSMPHTVNAEEETVPDNGIPVVYINIDESQGSIDDMIASPDHSVYCYGTVSIDVPEGFHYKDFPDLDLQSYENLKMNIRGRGNSTWSGPDKKPFKIKLDKKTDIFGMGKSKHWVLLANAMDPTLMRNRITYWLSEKLGFEFVTQGVPVDVVMKGDTYGTKYLGSYWLGENIRIDENRLDIGELEEDDVDLPTISGGYLIQDARQVEEGSNNRFVTERGVMWAADTPSFEVLDGGYENEAQKNYISSHFNMVEDVLYEGGEAYRELIDVPAAASYWLINTMAMNLDAYITSSTYIYKKRDENGVTGKLYWGPVWDLDYAWDEGLEYEGMKAGHPWVKPMFTDRTAGGFLEEIKKQWPAFKENVEYVISEGGLMDQYYAETKLSAEKDHEINPDQRENAQNLSYQESVEKLRTWIRNRLDWLDANINSIDSMVHTIDYVVDGESVAKDYCEISESVPKLPIEPEKEGYIFMGWYDQDGNETDYMISTDHDLTLTAKFIDEKDAPQAEDIVFAKNPDVIRFDPDNRTYSIMWQILPADTYDKSVSFASSDESIAAVDDYGDVTINKPGTVTITVTAANGVSRDLTLIITEEELPVPEKIYAENEVMHMTVGERALIQMHTEPALASLDSYSYESEDPGIAEADGFYGHVTAKAEGTTRIRVTSTSWIGEEQTHCETWVTVIVSNTPFTPEYTFTDAGSPAWKKGTKEGITFTVRRNEADETCFGHFKGVQVDGKDLIKDTDYTAKAGSTVVTLKPAYLEKLSNGEHTLTVLFDDGKAETKFTIQKADAKPAPAPDTSDHAGGGIWIAFMTISITLFALCLAFRYRMSD